MSSEIEPFDLDLSDVDLGIDELGDQDELPTEYDGQATYQAAGVQPVVVAGRMGRAASAQTSRRSTQNAQDSDMPVPAQATQGSKRARLKEKNRLAQARYRQRKLVRPPQSWALLTRLVVDTRSFVHAIISRRHRTCSCCSLAWTGKFLKTFLLPLMRTHVNGGGIRRRATSPHAWLPNYRLHLSTHVRIVDSHTPSVVHPPQFHAICMVWHQRRHRGEDGLGNCTVSALHAAVSALHMHEQRVHAATTAGCVVWPSPSGHSSSD